MPGSSLHPHGTRTRVASHYLRELTLGKFIVKHDDITLLDSIGEGSIIMCIEYCLWNEM